MPDESRVAALKEILDANPDDAFARYALGLEYSGAGGAKRGSTVAVAARHRMRPPHAKPARPGGDGSHAGRTGARLGDHRDPSTRGKSGRSLRVTPQKFFSQPVKLCLFLPPLVR